MMKSWTSDGENKQEETDDLYLGVSSSECLFSADLTVLRSGEVQVGLKYVCVASQQLRQEE